MPQFQQQQSETEDDDAEDFALADSFFNYDYAPDPYPNDFKSGCTRVEELPEAEAEGAANVGDLGLCGAIAIEEWIQNISLGDRGNGDDDRDKGHVSQSESSESESGSSSSSSSSTSSESDSSDDGGNEDEERDDDEKRVLEEGEIIESDDDDDDDGDKDNDADDVEDDHDHDHDHDHDDDEFEALTLVPPVNVTLELHHRMLPAGVVMSVLGAQVIVEGVEKHEPLNEGSILWMTESGKPLGLIDEIFGPVRNPYYVVRYNSEIEVPKGIRGGTLISFVPEFANHVLHDKDLYKKGYDYDEEASEEAEFSDDEKEAEYKRKQRMAKRGSNGRNHGKRKNKGKKFPPKEGVASAAPLQRDHGNCSTYSCNNGQDLFGSTIVAPAAPLHDQGHSSTFSGNNGQGLSGAPSIVPPLPPANAGPNFTTSGVWTNGATLRQPQPAMLPKGFPTSGIPLFLANTLISHQLHVLGVPFEQQLNPNQVFPSAAMFPAQPMYAQGLGGQNQMTHGLSSPFPQVQPHICPGQLGFPSSEMQPETNRSLASSSIPFNHHAPHRFHPGASANHGRKKFHPGDRKGWRPAK